MAVKAIELLLPSIIGALVIIAGWYVAHYLTSKRDQTNRRRDLRVQYLIEAYRRLEFASNREPMPRESAPEFEKAIADIQLLGTPKQVALAQAFARGFARKGTVTLDPLLNDLRQELRQELRLEPVSQDVKYLRFITDETQKK